MTPSFSIGVLAATLSPDPRQAAVLARQAGFAGLQFDAIGSGLDITALSASGRREFRGMLTQNNMRLIGLRAPTLAQGLLAGADVDKILWRWDQFLQAAAELQSPLVCIDPGPLPAADSDSIPLVDAALWELGRRADRYGVVVALRSDRSTFAGLHRAISAANCPWFGVDLDPPGLLADTWAIDQTFSRLGPLIRHVQGRDAITAADRRMQPAVVGRGSTPWARLLGLLDEAGYHGWITINSMDLSDPPAAAAAALGFFNSA